MIRTTSILSHQETLHSVGILQQDYYEILSQLVVYPGEWSCQMQGIGKIDIFGGGDGEGGLAKLPQETK